MSHNPRRDDSSGIRHMAHMPIPKLWLIATLALSFIIAFSLYLSTLAPTVTFEDSGELITAAYSLGVPHEPGYPLFTVLGRVFSMLPFGNVAYRLNLMSAFFSALGALFLTWAALLIIIELRNSTIFGSGLSQKHSKQSVEKSGTRFTQSALLPLAASLFAGILTATSYENWEQSIITEVYGLNTMFTALVLLLAIAWRQQPEVRRGEKGQPSRIRFFLLISYILGLMLSNHTTSLMFLPILFTYAFLEDRRFILNWKNLLSGAGFLLLGLTPYVYLPIASARNPAMDWGNPENWTNFWRTVSRHQYGLGLQQTFDKFMAELAAYGDLLLQQWVPFFLIFAVIGLVALFKFKRIYFYLSLLLLFFAAPVTTYITDFDVTIPNAFAAAEHKALVSVFYIPSYMGIALLAGVGIYYLIGWLFRRIPLTRISEYASAFAIIMLPLAFSYNNYRTLDMSDYYFTEDYAENLFTTVSDSGVVFTDWDPYSFPLNYYQSVEGKRTDILALDQKLLQRTWYIKWLKDHYPAFVRQSENAVENFLEAVHPFEAGEPYDGNYIQAKYLAMINAFIDHSMESGRTVYFTYNPPPGIAQNYFPESMVTALKLHRTANSITPLNPNSLQLSRFIDKTVNGDRMSEAFKKNYGAMILIRAQQTEKLGDPQEALKWYNLAKEFLSDNPQIMRQINAAITKVERQISNQ